MGARLRRFGHRPAILLAVCLTLPGAVGAKQPTSVPRVEIPPGFEDPRALTPEMISWVRTKVASGATDRQTLTRLLFALQSDDMGLQYQAGSTGSARDVMETRQFNCLSFAHLFVALSRELGVGVSYYAVSRPVSYGRERDFVLISEHVTAAWGSGPEQLTLEFSFGEEIDYQSGYRLSDRGALARHFSNHGAELLLAGDGGAAIDSLRLATELDPDVASVWVNLGVALRREGRLEESEAAYRRATAVDPEHLPAYHNLHALWVSTGRADAARRVISLLDRRSNRNPFTFLNLGDVSRRQGRLDEANRFYRRALALDGGAEADSRASLGLLALVQGDLDDARRWLTKAQRSDTENSRVVELAARLEMASQAHQLAAGGAEEP